MQQNISRPLRSIILRSSRPLARFSVSPIFHLWRVTTGIEPTWSIRRIQQIRKQSTKHIYRLDITGRRDLMLERNMVVIMLKIAIFDIRPITTSR
jgi:hypothetical protein